MKEGTWSWSGSLRVILTASEADLLEEVDDGVLLELLPPRPRVGVDVVAQAAAVEVICGGGEERGGTGRYLWLGLLYGAIVFAQVQGQAIVG